MANRYFEPLEGALHSGLVILDGYVSIGATGAVTSTTLVGASIARASAGTYTVTLTDKYQSLRGFSAILSSQSAVDLKPQVASVDVSSAKTLTLRWVAVATATDPSDGSGFFLTMILKNSSI